MTTFNDMWIKSTPEQKKRWAELMDSSVPTLSQMAYGHIKPSSNWAELFSLKLNDGSNKHSLFPDVFITSSKDDLDALTS